jgi:hypothetical protein
MAFLTLKQLLLFLYFIFKQKYKCFWRWSFSTYGTHQQLNVLVGGSNVLHQDSRYTYQQFNNEFFHEFGVNENKSSDLGFSLIDFKWWL